MPIDRLCTVRASDNKPLSLLLFFKAAGISAIVVKKGENKSNINSRNKGRNVLPHL
jgi:sugar/nucleoside kinase (ribokinase family)